MSSGKSGAALLSVVSNSVLIVLKLVAGLLTGSIAILTEAVHSGIDLLASLVALVSVRKADEPADEDHPYGHEKAENVAAGAEAMLILLGAAIIVIEAIRRLFNGSDVDEVVIGIVVISISVVANLLVSTYLYRRARELDSPALEGDAAHLRADSLTSVAVLVGLVLVEATGMPAFDSIAALTVAAFIVATGVRLAMRSGRVLMDEAPPADELDRIERAIAGARPPEMAGYHKLRARRAGSRRHIDLHVQFRSGTSLEEAHRLAHGLRDAIATEVRNADVLIHLEPEDSYRPPAEEPGRCAAAERSGQVDGRREPDGDDGEGISRVAVDREQERGDGADDDDGYPRCARDVHGHYVAASAGRIPISTEAMSSAVAGTAAERAVANLVETSADLRTCAIIDAEGVVLAGSGEVPWGEHVHALWEVADGAGRIGSPATQVHVATQDGELFATRADGITAVALADRFSLASLMFCDLRAALRDLAAVA